MSAAPYIQANINGTLQSADQPAISPLNRGFLYGDAIYEVWRTYRGVIFAWEEHWTRLENSAAALYMDLPFTRATILAEIRRTVKAFREHSGYTGELYIRIQVSRGAGPIGLDPALADRTDFVLIVQPKPNLSDEALRNGIKLSVATGLRRNSPATLNPAWKTGNYLNNILCLREARARGANEVLMTNLAGELTESAVCNVAFVRNGEVLTPPLAAGILEGITRGQMLREVGPATGIPVREAVLTPPDLPSMQECFLLSTTNDVQPVGAIDGHRYRTDGDTVSRRIKAGFADLLEKYYAKYRAELAV
ncbi:D-amino acid aminotransferase [Opitutaceae bacterium]